MMTQPSIKWPPDYTRTYSERQTNLLNLRKQPELLVGLREFYRTRPISFINMWGLTYDPRNAGSGDLPTRLPFILFPRQRQLVAFLLECLETKQAGLIEKCRDMGATWLCCAFSVWMWLYLDGSSVGWGSRKEQLVDRSGDPDSIFEKIRMIVRGLPPELLPVGFNASEHMTHMKIINPENESTITGEAGDNIGRGGRKTIYFKDESAHYERPELIEAALGDNTNVQIDISSVNGIGNVFHRRREAGEEWSPGCDIAPGKTRVFVMDWHDHPAKDEAWYADRKMRAINDGLLHLFKQEVDRDYAASVDGVIIPADWVKSAIDAHLTLKFKMSSADREFAGLDIADEGMDRNALVTRKGVVLTSASEWGERDVGVTTRKAIGLLTDNSSRPDRRHNGRRMLVEYDSIGVGAAVKAEVNRLKDDKLLPAGIHFVSWNAGSQVMEPETRVEETSDGEVPTNEEFFTNLKAQAWWSLRRRFEKTHRAITEGIPYSQDELISIPRDTPKLRTLQKELSQATSKKGTRLRLMVDKNPPGTHSPNMADAMVMCYFPVENNGYDESMSWV